MKKVGHSTVMEGGESPLGAKIVGGQESPSLLLVVSFKGEVISVF